MPSYISIIAVALALTSSLAPATPLYQPPPAGTPELSAADNPLGLTWVIVSEKKGSAYNNKQVKLRPLPGVAGGGLVAVDDHSPALVTNYKNSSLYSSSGRPQSVDLGPTGFLNLTAPVDAKTHLGKYAFEFGNVGDPSLSATTVKGGAVDTSWDLLQVNGGAPGTRRLTHDFRGELMGFQLCPAGQDAGQGSWFQVFYMVSFSGDTWDIPGCENVALRTNVTLA
ncbi:hypothetical protein GGR54DRAFT_237416 [Hypoxylon sp. NC1633]|nr:hypothetical protein GGR54DRAFT_237416 [Hypoxylon sp. NC1633]